MSDYRNTRKKPKILLSHILLPHALFTYFFLLSLLTFPTKLHAKDMSPSLIFTQEEMQEIDTIKKNMPRKKNTSTRLHLSAIMYQNDNQWTVWINGEAWNDKTIMEGVKIHQVNSQNVILSIIDSSGAESFITLKLNQSYNKLTNSIEENYE